MMGKDCERILSGINIATNMIISHIISIGSAGVHPIKIDGYYDETDSRVQVEYEEKVEELDIDISSFSSLLNSLNPDIEKMNGLENLMYTESTSFNNSCGSPWKELQRLKTMIEAVSNFDTSTLGYAGGRSALLGLLSAALVTANDAKWALIIYHDYIQRGYDAEYNDKKPSITYRKVDKKESMGNIEQDFEENVNIPKEPLEPF